MREPLPIACRTSAAYADATRRGGDPVALARADWEGGYRMPGEAAEPEHVLVLAGTRSFDELRAPAARADERWDSTEPTRFGRFAQRLWADLLDVEELSHR
jgi:exodeoxyribonuclease V gamma subunit